MDILSTLAKIAVKSYDSENSTKYKQLMLSYKATHLIAQRFITPAIIMLLSEKNNGSAVIVTYEIKFASWNCWEQTVYFKGDLKRKFLLTKIKSTFER